MKWSYWLLIMLCFYYPKISTGQASGDFRSASDGRWTNSSTWEEYNGSAWVSTLDTPTSTTNVTIQANHTVTLPSSGTRDCKNLTIESNGKFWANSTTMSSSRYLSLYGNIVCNGTIGNGNGNDDKISFYLKGSSTTISGSGSMTVNRIYKPSGATGQTTLIFGMDCQIRYNGNALYNYYSSSANSLTITINEGVTVELSGNGASPAGDLHLRTHDNLTIYGHLIVSGTSTNDAGASGLTIKSTSTGTGSLVTASAIGATVERYITVTTTAKNHFVSSPVSGDTIANILDATLGNYNAYKYDPAQAGNKWVRVFAGDNMTAGAGYIIPYSHATTNYKDITYSGTINTWGVASAMSSFIRVTTNSKFVILLSFL